MVLVDVAITSKPVTLAKSSSLRSHDLAMCQIGSKLLHLRTKPLETNSNSAVELAKAVLAQNVSFG